MATKHSKIKQALAYLKEFLTSKQEEYKSAAANLTFDQGWRPFNYDAEIYNLMARLEGSLYDQLYPKLFDDNHATDTEILNNINAIIKWLEGSQSLFKKVAQTSEEFGFLNMAAGIVQQLAIRALYQLKETRNLAKEEKKHPAQIHPNAKITQYQIGIITATPEEFEAVRKKMVNCEKLSGGDDDAIVYYSGRFEGQNKSLSVILARGLHQGIAAATIVTSKLIWKYSPQYVAMLGHAAGSKASTAKPELGDIIITTSSVNYQQVVNKTRKGSDGQLEQYQTDRKLEIPANPTWVRDIEEFAQQAAILNDIQKMHSNGEKFNKLRAISGKLITGDALMRSDALFDELIRDNPASIGLDMETYGVYYAAQHTFFEKKPLFISIKSVSDFGGNSKLIPKELERPDIRVDYAIHTSVEFFYRYSLAAFLSKCERPANINLSGKKNCPLLSKMSPLSEVSS